MTPSAILLVLGEGDKEESHDGDINAEDLGGREFFLWCFWIYLPVVQDLTELVLSIRLRAEYEVEHKSWHCVEA